MPLTIDPTANLDPDVEADIRTKVSLFDACQSKAFALDPKMVMRAYSKDVQQLLGVIAALREIDEHPDV